MKITDRHSSILQKVRNFGAFCPISATDHEAARELHAAHLLEPDDVADTYGRPRYFATRDGQNLAAQLCDMPKNARVYVFTASP